jgi:hypothetical protein
VHGRGTGTRSGIWQWTREDEDKPFAWISYRVTTWEDGGGTLILDYHINGVPKVQHFVLYGAPCRFGGRRWFVVCPETGANVSKLYSLTQAGFRSCQAQRAAYRCQNESKLFDRAIRQRNKVLRKLKTWDVDFQRKPKWMRWRTYGRLQARLQQAQMACTAGMMMHLQGLGSQAFSLGEVADMQRAALNALPRRRRRC